MHIEFLKYLEDEKMEKWVEMAEKMADEPVYAFTCAWIAFNYYYDTYATVLGSYGDASDWEVLELVSSDQDFDGLYNEFKKENSDLFPELFIPPIKGDSTDAPPDSRKVFLINYSSHQMVSMLYVVRCNLFHGTKNPTRFRDRDVLDVSARILVPFMRELVDLLKVKKAEKA